MEQAQAQAKTGETQAPDLDSFLKGWLHQTAYVMIRGSMAAMPHVPPEKIMLMFSMVVAQILAECYAGDELSVHKFRKAARDVFAEPLRKIPVTPLPKAVVPTAGIGAQ